MIYNEKEQQTLAKIEKIIMENNTDYFTKLKTIQKIILVQLDSFYKPILADYIKNEWENCEIFRIKIYSEGDSYFYFNYTTVPVPWNVFKSFSNSDDCWCGNCEENEHYSKTDNETDLKDPSLINNEEKCVF